MVAWPDTAELAQVLNVDNVEDWETTLDRVMAAAIAQVKMDVGDWDEYEDVPTDKLAQAALRMAELISQRPEAQSGYAAAASFRLTADPTYQRLLTGHRRRFGIA